MKSKRQLLAGLGSLFLLSGCVRKRAPKAELGTISVENNADSEIRLEVRITRDGTEVVDDSVLIPPAEESGYVTVRETVPGDPGRYELHTSIAGSDQTEVSEFTKAECVDVRVKYHPPRLSHYTKTRDGRCASRERLDGARSADAAGASSE